MSFNFVFSFSIFCGHFIQEWDKKAVEAKDRYVKALREYEANGGDRNAGTGGGKKRGKTSKSKPAKKGKKRADSDDDDEEDESD